MIAIAIIRQIRQRTEITITDKRMLERKSIVFCVTLS